MFEIEYDNLNGMPLHIINTFENIDTDNVKIKLNKSNYDLCMTYIHDSKVRSRIERTYSKNKYKHIMKQITELILLRDKKSKLLSYANHNEYILSSQMCKSTEQVQQFLGKLLESPNSSNKSIDTI
jgi:Zn-dependent oligopeptidase